MIGSDNPIRRLERIDDAEWYEAVPANSLQRAVMPGI